MRPETPKKRKARERRDRVADRDANAEREFWQAERQRQKWPLKIGTRVQSRKVPKLHGAIRGYGDEWKRAYLIDWDRPHLADRHLGFDYLYASPTEITT